MTFFFKPTFVILHSNIQQNLIKKSQDNRKNKNWIAIESYSAKFEATLILRLGNM